MRGHIPERAGAVGRRIPEGAVAGNVGVRALQGARPKAARPAARPLHAERGALPQANWAGGR